MRAIEITYDFKMENCLFGEWERRVFLPKDSKDYERCVNLVHQNPDKYKIVSVKHTGGVWAN